MLLQRERERLFYFKNSITLMACALAETGAARPSLQPFCMKNTQRRVWKATPANPLVFSLDGYPASPQNEIHARTGGAQGNPRLGECKWDWVPRASSLANHHTRSRIFPFSCTFVEFAACESAFSFSIHRSAPCYTTKQMHWENNGFGSMCS